MGCCCVQEHAERPEVVQQLMADAQLLAQQAHQLEVRLDKDVTKLQVICCCPIDILSRSNI